MSNDVFDFDDLQVDDQTAWFEMPEITPDAQICCSPAAESNKGYYNALLRRSGSRARRMARTQQITAADADANRSEDRELFPRYIVKGWKGVLNKKTGEPVPFNADTCREFCAKLPAWLFDRLRNFAGTPERFLPEGADPVPDAVELAGNSKTGSGGASA